MKSLIFLFLFSGFFHAVTAQPREIELSSEYDKENNLVIKVRKNVPGRYFIGVHFTELYNSNMPRIQGRTVAGSGDFLTLRPLNRNEGVRVRYQYYSMPGDPDCKPDTAFVYRLPYSTAVSRQVDSLYLIGRSIESINRRNIDWYALEFRMERGDTVYAARTGLVTSVKTDAADPEAPESGRYTFKADVNSVTVEHADGTIAEYSVLEGNSVMVSPGDRIFPDTPLGLAGTYDNERYRFRLRIHYLRLRKNSPEHTPFQFDFHYVRPLFTTEAGAAELTMRQEYRPIVTRDMITREMSRRELRNYQE